MARAARIFMFAMMLELAVVAVQGTLEKIRTVGNEGVHTFFVLAG
jgi:hypothetical protein